MKINEIKSLGLTGILFGSLKWILSSVGTIWWITLIIEPFKIYYTNMQKEESLLLNKQISQKNFDEYHISQLSELIGKVAAQVVANKVVTKVGLPLLSKIPLIGNLVAKVPPKLAQSYVMSNLNTPEASEYIAIAIMTPVFQQFVSNVGAPVEEYIKSLEKKAEVYFNSLAGISNKELGTSIPKLDTSKPWIDMNKPTTSTTDSNLAPNGLPWADSSQIFGGGFDPRAKKN